MSTFYATFLSESDFSFAFLLITFEPLKGEQSYIPLLKALMCGINAVGAQGCGCMFTFYHASLKIAVLLHKMPKVPFVLVLAVHTYHIRQNRGLFSHGNTEKEINVLAEQSLLGLALSL